MIRFTLAALLAAATAAAAQAAPKRMEQSLKRLDPATRFEQVCDMEAMVRIRRDPKKFRPDRAVGSAAAEVKIAGTTMQGEGGAFRNKGQWYRYSFKCTTSADHMKVQAFDVKIGEEIPKAKWEEYGLW